MVYYCATRVNYDVWFSFFFHQEVSTQMGRMLSVLKAALMHASMKYEERVIQSLKIIEWQSDWFCCCCCCCFVIFKVVQVEMKLKSQPSSAYAYLFTCWLPCFDWNKHLEILVLVKRILPLKSLTLGNLRGQCALLWVSTFMQYFRNVNAYLRNNPSILHQIFLKWIQIACPKAIDLVLFLKRWSQEAQLQH